MLKPRRKPSQARSRERVDRILDAAAELLVEQAFDAVTTRLIAEKAGIPVGSIYQFFPNKYAIFNALALRYLDKFAEAYQSHVTPHGADGNWEKMLDSAITGFSEMLYANKAISILWAGMQNSPELRAAEALYIAKGVEFNVALLDYILPHVDPAQRRMIGRIIMGVFETLVRLADVEPGPLRPRFIRELKLLLNAYIRSYLPPGTARK